MSCEGKSFHNGIPNSEPLPIGGVATLSQIDVQLSKAKAEIYRVKNLAEHHVHKERRQTMLELWQKAYEAFDELQAFVLARTDK